LLVGGAAQGELQRSGGSAANSSQRCRTAPVNMPGPANPYRFIAPTVV
jgi:hypothetical protein